LTAAQYWTKSNLILLPTRSGNREEAMNDLPPAIEPEPASEERGRITPAQWGVIVLTLAIAAGSILYKLLLHENLGHSAAMFIGIPVVLAILLALTPKTKSVTGAILKGITLALLLVAPLLGEGFLCILIASPLFYLIGICIGVAVDYGRKHRGTTLSCLTLVLLPMCMEGVLPGTSFSRQQTVSITQTVNAPASLVEQSIAQSPRVDLRLPLALRIGFPPPLAANGSGLAVGSTRTIHFAGAEGDPPGDLVLRVAEYRSGYVRFETVSDSSKLTQWLRWTSSEVAWQPLDSTHTQVTWRIQFDRQLDPAWYFTPWERIMVHEAGRYLIAANASPER
jgi:hypothetical protein